MSTFDDIVNEVRSTLRGYNLVKEQVTFLSGALAADASSITVDDGSLVQPGVVEIGSEAIYVQSIAGNVLTVSPDGRGWDRTTAAIHADDARVTVSPPYPSWRIERAINDAIVGTGPTLYGIASTSFTFTPATSTYELPAACVGVLQVTATDIGPSQAQPEIHHFRVDLNAPVAEFATGKCITLMEAPAPGQTVTVVYQKAPAELTTGQDFTTSGLAETARPCVVYGAVARLLSFVDVTRTLTDSAQATEFADVQRVGTATTLAAQMTARYQLELDQEQARLRRAHPVKVRWIGR